MPDLLCGRNSNCGSWSENELPQRLGSRLGRLQNDLVAECFQPADQAPLDGLPIPLIEVASAQLLVGRPALEQMVDDAENGVAHRHRGSPWAAASRQPPILRREVGFLRPPGRLARLHQQGPQMRIALAGLATPPLTRAFVIPGCYPGPRGEVSHTR